MDLTIEQHIAVEGIVSALLNGEECSLTGLAGTGKTTVTKAIYDSLVRKGVPVCTMCPAAKAAMVLTKKGVPATTIHRIIYNYRGKRETDEGDIELIFNPKDGKLRNTIFIVDESSMVTTSQARDIRNHRLPTLWVGDPGQLPPVKSGITDVLRCKNRWHLKQIHRQAEGSPIIQFAHALRRGASLTSQHPGIRYVKVNGGGAYRIVEDMIENGVSCLVVKTNEQRVALNAAYRKLLGREGIVAPGDEIICIANNKNLGVINGEMMTVLAVEAHNDSETKVRVQSEVGWKASVWVRNEQFGRLGRIDDDEEYDPGVMLADYGYAKTCHKMQGSSCPHVGITNAGYCGEVAAWNYTALTRGEENATVYW